MVSFTRFLSKLRNRPVNFIYPAIRELVQHPAGWPQFYIPALLPDVSQLRQLGLLLFTCQPGLPRPPASFIPPWSPPPCRLPFSLLDKRQTITNRSHTVQFFSLLAKIPNSSIVTYSDGSVTCSPNSISCAIFIPALHLSKS